MSIGLALAFLAMISLALGLLLVPLLWRRRASPARDAYNLSVYRDQLAEVERDVGRGLLNPEQAEAARTEIGRRILALRPAEAEFGVDPRRLAAATGAILVLPVVALLLYGQLGSPSLPDQPFAERQAAGTNPAAGQAPHIDVQQAVAQLDAHLKQHPEDLAGWILLGRTELSLGNFKKSAEAYRHAVELSGHRADVVGDWAEAEVMASGGMVTPAAHQAFEAGLKDPGTAPRARYYLALAQEQQGDVKGALQAWSALVADSPADAQWLPVVRERIAEAAAKLGLDPAALKTAGGAAPTPSGGPSPGAVSAAAQATAGAPPELRDAMIAARVSRLAARLAQQPDDVDGWARLGRSYMVLGEPDRARDAYAHAMKLKPGDAALQEALAEATRAAAAKSTAPPPGR